eukprot:5286858-Alexandrium_andersonii.AAC.1
MDLSVLWMPAPSRFFRAMRERETCTQFGTQQTLVLFGLPDTLRPVYLSAFNAALPDLCVLANKSEAEVLVCAKPACNIWPEQRIAGVLGIWGSK